VRYEYIKVPLCIYARNRKAVLSNFLKRDRIYSTKEFYEEFEMQARDNVEGEIRRL